MFFFTDVGTLSLLLPVNVGRGRPLTSGVFVIMEEVAKVCTKAINVNGCVDKVDREVLCFYFLNVFINIVRNVTAVSIGRPLTQYQR